MNWPLIAAYAYLIVVCAFLVMTYINGLGGGKGWDADRVLGLSLSLLWPLLIFLIFVVANEAKGNTWRQFRQKESP